MAAAQVPPLIKGVSLGQDAWRRLRKSRVAMLCLFTIGAIALSALFTPLLPLAPPDRQRTELQYEAPWQGPLVESTFELDWEAIGRTPDLTQDVQQELEQALAAGDADEVKREKTELENIVQSPYRTAGFPQLGPLSRWMVRLRSRLFGPWSIASLCGRDELGRDVLSRLFWGARISLLVGLVAGTVSLVIGVSYGSIAGYSGGNIDNAMMRLVDVLYSIPFMFIVIYFMTIINQPLVRAGLEDMGISRMTVFFFLVGAIEWLTMARVVRGQVISLKTEPFVEAARATGAGQSRIIGRHIFPNLVSIVIVYLTLTIPRVMLFEAFLSFLGLGVEPPDVSWGLLANEGIRVITPVRVVWWLILFPSLALGITLFALNFLGDRLRDALDPRLASR
jgi:oligopeptide transport system permease protein